MQLRQCWSVMAYTAPSSVAFADTGKAKQGQPKLQTQCCGYVQLCQQCGANCKQAHGEQNQPGMVHAGTQHTKPEFAHSCLLCPSMLAILLSQHPCWAKLSRPPVTR